MAGMKAFKQRMMGTTLLGSALMAAGIAAPLVAISMPTVAVAQAQSGSLRVAITGEGGAAVSGATVVVSSPDSLLTRTGVTGADGRVRISGLDPATNYTVAVTADGYSPYSASSVAVVSGRDLSLTYALSSVGSDTTRVGDIVVTGRSLAAIDTTSATVATTLTLGVVESLPTGRNYQSYLQLVPGVKPGSNPSSKSGVNSSVTGVTGSSSDNIYILDGVNVTDPVTGTFGANFNSEIIQEQQVITGGVPAEYEGGAGLISSVITKSGSNEWHGSLNYYFQNDGLVQDDKHGESAGFSTYDTAFTLGGPILRDRLWFFGSYQKKYREDEVTFPGTEDVQRVVTNEAEYGFAKLTWQITDDDRLTVSYFNDPTEISGTSNASTRNYRDTSQVQGGDKYKIDYTRTWGDLLLNAYWYKHESELTTLAADQSVRNNVNFRRGDTYTYEQANIGGAGANTERFRNREEFGLKLEYYLETGFGTHTIKAGYSQSETQSVVNSLVPGGATYTSLGSQYAGTTFDELAKSQFTSAVFSDDDRARIIAGIDSASNRAALYGIVDADGDGVLTPEEISAITFSDTAGNPGSQINAYRSLRVADGPNDVRSEGKALYLQDTWTYDNWTVNAGIRAEEWTHVASNGEELFTFDWAVAPRLSVVYDLQGDGRSKVWAFIGRYYDPPRNDMTGFAGSLSGAVNEEQINIGGNWVTFRTRGGAQVLDSIFAPSTETPYTDEYVLGYSRTFGRDIGLTVTATKRATRDIMEDYDLAVYSDPNGSGAAGNATPDSKFYIPYEYFGLSADQISAVQAGQINYVLGTLRGGKRDYWGYEITLQKFKTDNWQASASYTYNDAQGNTSSDSNAGVQGDFIYLDPRAPNTWGNTPGNIKHLFKAYGSYEFDFGLELAGVFNWNSGIVYTPIDYLYGYVAGPRGPASTVDGVTSTWLLPGYTGKGKGPSYYTFDVRASYDLDLSFGKVELFLDVFNVLNKQSATSVFTNRAGSADYDFGEANNWVAPRRAYLGVRYSF